MRCVFAIATVLAGSAFADPADSVHEPAPPRFLIGVGIGGPGVACCAGEADTFPTALIVGRYFEAGYRPFAKYPIYARVMVLGGEWATEAAGGSWLNVRGGAELRACDGAWCGFLDADAGYLQVAEDGGGRVMRGPSVGGRLGADVGSRHVRVRVAVDASAAVAGKFTASYPCGETDSYRTVTAVEIGLALAF